MIDRLSARSTALLREAHRDAPTLTQRTEIWKDVEAAVATSAVAAGGVKALGGLAKLLIGAVIGGVITATVVALVMGPRAPRAPEPVMAAPVIEHTAVAPRAIPPRDDTATETADNPPPVATVIGKPPTARAAPVVTVQDDPLAREARLVAEARGALRRGDADQALSIVRAARAAPNPALEPEELALESRALRNLGRTAEADAVAADLARRFPENALGR